MVHIDAGFGFRFGDYPWGDLRRWRLERELAGGGALMDVGIDALQACRYLTGQDPNSVMARETKTDPIKFAEVDETILWSMEFPNGVTANCSTTYGFGGINHARPTQTEANLAFRPHLVTVESKGFRATNHSTNPQLTSSQLRSMTFRTCSKPMVAPRSPVKKDYGIWWLSRRSNNPYEQGNASKHRRPDHVFVGRSQNQPDKALTSYNRGEIYPITEPSCRDPSFEPPSWPSLPLG
ncbi:MAG: hypothetical protein GY768_12235 [Planctomycetaceae bacterium]|nr:hypothetical protein [Planctomycetaceae bacterium]